MMDVLQYFCNSSRYRGKKTMEIESQMEFAVDMTCNSCANAIHRVCENKPIEILSLDVQKQQVLLKTTMSFQDVQDTLEETGKRVALVGYGSGVGQQKNLGAAVAEIRGDHGVNGVVRVVQLSEDKCLVDGTIDGLAPGEHGLNVHEFGDLTNGCNSCGDHFNPYGFMHGSRLDKKRHVGDLGNIKANEQGRSTFRFLDERLKVWDIIGRSMVVHEKADDLGKGNNKLSLLNGNSGIGIGCAIIARSSGLFQNSKRICTCDGIPIWDEQNVPAAGKKRSVYAQAQL